MQQFPHIGLEAGNVSLKVGVHVTYRGYDISC